MDYIVRKALLEDLEYIPAIERAAGRLFGSYGLEAAVFADATDATELLNAQKSGLLWVAEYGNRLVGFAFVEKIESGLILAELDVLPAFGKRGIGTKLIHEVINFAATNNFKNLFLTTYRAIPWNGPFYKRLGFEILPEKAYPKDIRDIVDREHNTGLDKKMRVVMVYLC